jgi:8-oxo-dGTP pyrophosphatase MutT (NUDIX family)
VNEYLDGFGDGVNDDLVNRRATGRVILLDGRGRVLLLSERSGHAGSTIWMTPGGAAKAGETHAQAAQRELREELGLRVSLRDLGEPVATQRGQFTMRGTCYEAHDQFFVAWVDSFEPDMGGMTEIERELVTGARWWTVAELEKADAVVFPHQLPELVRRLTSSGAPDVPWELEWHQA